MLNYDVVVIGGGPAGMSAGLTSAKNGCKTLIIERNPFLGGILRQCIHNGFGLHYFGEELTGPEYADRFVKQVKKQENLDVLINTFVTEVKGKTLTITNQNGVQKVKCKALILAMGCRERTASNITLTGTRPVGVYTAGAVQKMVNIYGKMPAKNVVILGSGDIGLIMARRLTTEGANVIGVFEINSTTSGLRRNIVQCLEDYNIPLYLNTTITDVVGDTRVEGVYVAQVDEKYNIKENTKKFIKCDGVVLSVGLVPEMDLMPNLPYNRATKSTFVNDYLECSEEGVFVCGNVLHVHDLVDNVTLEGEQAGNNASFYVKNKLSKTQQFNVVCGNNISYVVPNSVYGGVGETSVKFRVKSKCAKCTLAVKCNGEVIAKKFVMASLPGEMNVLKIPKNLVKGDITVEVMAWRKWFVLCARWGANLLLPKRATTLVLAVIIVLGASVMQTTN